MYLSVAEGTARGMADLLVFTQVSSLKCLCSFACASDVCSSVGDLPGHSHGMAMVWLPKRMRVVVVIHVCIVKLPR